MELTTNLSENCSLEDLNNDWKLSTLYTAFLVPKTQQEAVKLIYKIKTIPGKKAPRINRPVQWITDTREKLMDMGFLIKTDNKLKNSIIKANIEPIIQSLIKTGSEDSNDPVVLKGVRLVLESFWFRDFFSYDMLHSPINYKNGEVYEPFQGIIKNVSSDEKQQEADQRKKLPYSRLDITDLQNRIFQLLSEIGYYSHNIRYVLKRIKKIPRHQNEDPLFDVLIGGNNFDTLCSNYTDEIPQNFIELYRSSSEGALYSTMASYYPERLFKKLLNEKAALCIPSQVSILLRSTSYIAKNKPLDCGYIQRDFIKKWHIEKKKMNDEKLNVLYQPD